MTCDYEELDFFDEETGKKGKLYRPTLGVTLIKRGFKLFPVACLLDSGADTIIFPADIANYLNVNYKKGHKIPSHIAGGGITNFYEVPFEKHGISIFIDDVRINEKICFSEGQKMPLLGQDFFKHFKISFNRKAKTFSLEAV